MRQDTQTKIEKVKASIASGMTLGQALKRYHLAHDTWYKNKDKSATPIVRVHSAPEVITTEPKRQYQKRSSGTCMVIVTKLSDLGEIFAKAGLT